MLIGDFHLSQDIRTMYIDTPHPPGGKQCRPTSQVVNKIALPHTVFLKVHELGQTYAHIVTTSAIP